MLIRPLKQVSESHYYTVFVAVFARLLVAKQVSELSTVKSQFAKKYGNEYVRSAELNEDGCVNPKVVEKLDCQPPSGFVVTVSFLPCHMHILFSPRFLCPP